MPVHKMFQKHGDILRLQVCYLLVAGFWAQNSSQPTQPKPNQHTVHVRWGRVSRLCRVYNNTRSLGNPRKCHRRNVKKTRTRRKTLAWITFRPIMSSSFRHSRVSRCFCFANNTVVKSSLFLHYNHKYIFRRTDSNLPISTY